MGCHASFVHRTPECDFEPVAVPVAAAVNCRAVRCAAMSREGYLTGLPRFFRPGMESGVPVFQRASRNPSASYSRSKTSQSAAGKPLTRVLASVESLISPAIMKTWIGCPTASLTAGNFVRFQPLGLPIRRPRAPFPSSGYRAYGAPSRPPVQRAGRAGRLLGNRAHRTGSTPSSAHLRILPRDIRRSAQRPI